MGSNGVIMGLNGVLWVPHCLNVTLWSEAECRAAQGDDVTEGAICAGGVKGEDSCQGDSGSPLRCGGALQAVVWAGPTPCGQDGKPGLYGDVMYYKEWILSVMGAQSHS
uniref:Peptidase S1 domain-containing protein n=1 Tax=Coturnix japonica TaxID=93934 RepID=A0A8C2Y7Y3_COTJA